MKIKFIFLLCLILICGKIQLKAQVTVGSANEPEKGALLDIKDSQPDNPGGITSTTGGLILPRVILTDRNELFPFFDVNLKGNTEYETKEKLSHTGLTVYHIGNEDWAEGIYFWNGEEWKKIEETLGKAELTIECSDIIVKGSYVVGQNMTSDNYLEIKVTVTKPGSYSLMGTTDNNYIFITSGEFHVTGEYTLIATSQGTPEKAGTDELVLTNFGEEIEETCRPNIIVASNIADYILYCSSTTVRGVYKVNEPLNYNTHFLELNIFVNEVGSYSISSTTDDGISFYGSGEFTSIGPQVINIYGQGTPSNTYTKTITLTTNSIGGTSTQCEVDIRMVIPKKRILSLGSGSWAIHGNGGTALIFNSPANFGTLEESTFKIEATEVIGVTTTSITLNQIQSYIAPTGENELPVDIVFITYDADFATINPANLLIEYIKKGGVVIFLNEHMSHNLQFFKNLFDDIAIAGQNDITVGGWIYKLPNYNDAILNGPFGDLRGAYLGEDQGYGDAFTYLPPSEIEWSFSSYDYSGYNSNGAGSLSQIFGFKAKNYNFFWCGDGGIGSYNGGTSTTSYPVALDSSNRPISKSYGRGTTKIEVENGRFIANLFCWAFEQAEFNGINTK